MSKENTAVGRCAEQEIDKEVWLHWLHTKVPDNVILLPREARDSPYRIRHFEILTPKQ